MSSNKGGTFADAQKKDGESVLTESIGNEFTEEQNEELSDGTLPMQRDGNGQISMFEDNSSAYTPNAPEDGRKNIEPDLSDGGFSRMAKRENDEPNEEKQSELVGFSTGDDELDRLINNGESDGSENFAAGDTDGFSVGKKSDENDGKKSDDKSDRKTTDDGLTSRAGIAKVGDQSEQPAKSDDDYSYYGTIKPIAENAGIADKKADAGQKAAVSASPSAEDILKAEIENARILAEKEKERKKGENERIKASLDSIKGEAVSIVNGIKKSITGVYDEIFKNNPAFKTPIEKVIKNIEEYIQALLLSRALLGEANFECYPEFVYEILPEGDIFVGTFDDLSLNVKLAGVLKTQPTAMLMLAAVDVSFNRGETKKLIDDIYSLYSACVSALGQRAPSKDEVMFNMLTFAKNQGVVL